MFLWGCLLAGTCTMGIGIILMLAFWKAGARYWIGPLLACLGFVLIVMGIHPDLPGFRSNAQSMIAALQPTQTIQPVEVIQAPAPSAVPNNLPFAAVPTAIPTFTPGPATFQPVTWMQLVSFLDADHTNWNKYDPVQYNCVDFAVDLVANATRQDIQAWVVGVTFAGNQPDHAFVGFKTSDYGNVYIEPQTDNPYWGLEVGRPLCDSWGTYQCMGTVTTIEYLQCDHAHDCMTYTP